MRKVYFYEGKYRTVADISRMTQVSARSLYNRLSKGMPLAEALSIPCFCELSASDVALLNRKLIVKFTKPIYTVNSQMQPSLCREYVAKPHFLPSDKSHTARIFYTVVVGNNKPLIVYAGEFEPVRIAENREDISWDRSDTAFFNVAERNMMSWLRKANISACSAL